MPELIVVTGPPGLGKSTVSALVADAHDPGALVAGDAFFGFLRRGEIPPWEPASLAQNQAVLEASGAAAGRLARHCTVVFDGILGPWFLADFLAASGAGVLHYAVLSAPLATCLDRIAARVDHPFSDVAAASHMWREFDGADVEDRHRIDATAPAAQVAEAILAGVASGTLRTR